MKINGFADLHLHTVNSDGINTPTELLDKCREAGIKVLAITDHNYMTDPRPLREAYPDMTLLTGAEVSAVYSGGERDKEIHIVAVGFDPDDPDMAALLQRNQPDRRPYIEAILAALRNCGIDLGTYEYLRDKYSTTKHLGRGHIAAELMAQGYVETQDEAFDEYIGAFGRRRAYVESGLSYVSMEDAVAAIRKAGGVAILAHLYYYRMDEAGQLRLVRDFKACGGQGMETLYGGYDEAQRARLISIADDHGLMHSVGSDHHGRLGVDRLDHGFTTADCAALLEALLIE